jgi:hypothetical protein
LTKRLLALLAVLALTLSACSDSDDGDTAADGAQGTATTTAAETSTTTAGGTEGGSTGPDTELSRIVDRLSQESARFEGTMHLVGTPGSQMSEPVDVPVTGAFDPAHRASQISMDLSAVAQAALGDGEQMPPGFEAVFDEPMEVISVGDKSWIKFSLLKMMAGADTQWIEVSPEQTGELTSGLGLGWNFTSPTSLLEQLRGADGDVEELGNESIRGEETTHYRIDVDVAALSTELPSEEQDQLQDDLGQLDKPLPVEFWVGGDDRLYRYRVEIADTTPNDDDQTSVSLQFEFFDHGATIDIQPPPADQVTSMEELDSVVGGALGGGAGATEGSTESGGGSSSGSGTSTEGTHGS